MDNQSLLKSIRRAANVGLYGSLTVGLLTLVEYFLAAHVWVHRIVTNEYTHRLLFVAAPVLTVVGLSVILFSLNRRLRQLRQLDTVEQKLIQYRSLMRGVYGILLALMVLCSAVVVITGENIVIMMLLLLFFMAVMSYPNMYKMKADLGFIDEEMTMLFGDKYISGRTTDHDDGKEDKA